MIGYVLPTSNGRRVLWYPSPRIVWGTLEGQDDTVTVLAGYPDKANPDDISLMTKDNVHRPTIRMSLSPMWRFYWVGRLMMWGVIWLVGMDRPTEDWIGGLYLLLGLPMFIKLTGDAIRGVMGAIKNRFDSLTYYPKIELKFSKRLQKLEEIIDKEGILYALNILDELGLDHLREFYRRVAWQTRWETPPPTGQGIVNE